MFVVNDDQSIYVTQGDIVFFSVGMEEGLLPVSFRAGDIVRIKIFGKNDADNVVLQKEFHVTEDVATVDIFLTGNETKIGDVISKPKDYWYEIVLNDDTNPRTIVGYDEDGAKLFKLFPEGGNIHEYDPVTDDLPSIDSELDMTSHRPIENQAVARALAALLGRIEALESLVAQSGTEGDV